MGEAIPALVGLLGTEGAGALGASSGTGALVGIGASAAAQAVQQQAKQQRAERERQHAAASRTPPLDQDGGFTRPGASGDLVRLLEQIAEAKSKDPDRMVETAIRAGTSGKPEAEAGNLSQTGASQTRRPLTPDEWSAVLRELSDPRRRLQL